MTRELNELAAILAVWCTQDRVRIMINYVAATVRPTNVVPLPSGIHMTFVGQSKTISGSQHFMLMLPIHRNMERFLVITTLKLHPNVNRVFHKVNSLTFTYSFVLFRLRSNPFYWLARDMWCCCEQDNWSTSFRKFRTDRSPTWSLRGFRVGWGCWRIKSASMKAY